MNSNKPTFALYCMSCHRKIGSRSTCPNCGRSKEQIKKEQGIKQ